MIKSVKFLPLILLLLTLLLNMTSCSSSLPSFTSDTTEKQPATAKRAEQTALWAGNANNILDKLQRQSTAKLSALLSTTNDPTQTAWIELALISKRNSNNTLALAQALTTWRTKNPSHPANRLIPDDATLNQLASIPPPQQIAILLPLQGFYGSSGQTVREGFLNAYYTNLPRVGKQNVSRWG